MKKAQTTADETKRTIALDDDDDDDGEPEITKTRVVRWLLF